jgi:hypothetical protein
MGLPVVDRFLCCMSLKTGGIILAISSIILSFFGITILSVSVAFLILGIKFLPQNSIDQATFLGILTKHKLTIIF